MRVCQTWVTASDRKFVMQINAFDMSCVARGVGTGVDGMENFYYCHS
jgi:hypothetical protein